MSLTIDPKWILDPDALAVLRHWDEKPGSLVLEVGANDNHTANVLAANGHQVLGVDLRRHTFGDKAMINYPRILMDFVQSRIVFHEGQFDAVVSTSAIEHFGMRTYAEATVEDDDYDCKAMDAVYDILRPGGTCYITVPYGREFIVNKPHWRVYDALTLQERIVRKFGGVQLKEFFASGPVLGWHDGEILSQDFAGSWSGEPPHVAVLLKMRKIV